MLVGLVSANFSLQGHTVTGCIAIFVPKKRVAAKFAIEDEQASTSWRLGKHLPAKKISAGQKSKQYGTGKNKD